MRTIGFLLCFGLLLLGGASAPAGEDGSCDGLKGAELKQCRAEERKAVRELRYGGAAYKKARLVCAICDDMRRTEARPSTFGKLRGGAGSRSGFTNKKLEDDLLRYRTTYGEHFAVGRCREQETRDLCRKYRIVERKQQERKKKSGQR